MAKVTGFTGKTNYRIAIYLSRKILANIPLKYLLTMFPDLGDYLTMLDKAARMDDTDLIDYLTERWLLKVCYISMSNSISAPDI
jgi:hypothetical protein